MFRSVPGLILRISSHVLRMRINICGSCDVQVWRLCVGDDSLLCFCLTHHQHMQAGPMRQTIQPKPELAWTNEIDQTQVVQPPGKEVGKSLA